MGTSSNVIQWNPYREENRLQMERTKILIEEREREKRKKLKEKWREKMDC